MQRFLAGRKALLSHVFEGDGEEPIQPATVTVTLTRQGGLPGEPITAIPGSEGVFLAEADGLAQGVYSALWDGVDVQDTDWIEVVGGQLFTLAQLRKADEELTADRYPAWLVREVADVVAQEFETITGRSFYPRTAFVQWTPGDPFPRLDVENARILSGADWLPVELDKSEPIVWPAAEVAGDGPLWVELDYGFRKVPADIREAALLRTKILLFEASSGIPDRATSFQPGDGGTYILSTAGRRGALTGIPDVDAPLARYGFPILDSLGWGLA
ncbi:hypothetical protein ACQPZJ_35425 [Actinoplanes sp. CA-054009]